MTITAKFPGKCAICGKRFPAGEQIEWKRGEPSRHPACGAEFAEQMALPNPKPKKRYDDQFPELDCDRRDEWEEPAPAVRSSGGKASAGHAPSAPRPIRKCEF